jgi:transcriptional regulator with XRE-family HTH domain
MSDLLKKGGVIRIGERIQSVLDAMGKNPAWLAEMVGVSRSTITRILNCDRNPTPKTLHEIAPVLGFEVAQLVAGTDAADRVKEAQDIVSRHDYEQAVRQLIEYERKANDLGVRVGELTERAEEERQRTRKLNEQLAASERRLVALADEREAAVREARHHEEEGKRHREDADRYRQGLEKAVADVVALRAQVRELGAAVEAGRTTARVGAILAGVAAAVSVASYLGGDTKGNPAPKRPPDGGTKHPSDDRKQGDSAKGVGR